MYKAIFTVLILMSTFIGLYAQEKIPNQLIVMFRHNCQPQATFEKEEFDSHFKKKLRNQKVPQLLSSDLNCWLYTWIPNALSDESLIKEASTFVNVEAVQFNYIGYERTSIPNDTLFYLQSNMLNTGQFGGTPNADISATQAWDITTGGISSTGDTIVVAVIDGGFQLTHPDLDYYKNHSEISLDSIDNDNNGYIDDYDGWNSVSNSGTIQVSQHGTHVCGIVGAIGNNQIGVAGVNWHVKIMPVKGTGNSLTDASVIAAYGYVLKQRKLYNSSNGSKGAFVVATNSSFGIDTAKIIYHPIWCAMYDSLGFAGILSATATANNSVNIDVVSDIPTACTSNFMIAVTNTTNTDHINNSAGYGIESIDIGAPGTAIYSTYPNNTYNPNSGTSMATPHVAGAVALMVSAGSPAFMQAYKDSPSSIALLIKNQMMLGVDSLSSFETICKSQGRLNLFNAVSLIKNFPDSMLYAKTENLNNYKFTLKNILPNPAADNFEVQYFLPSSTILQIQLYDLSGSKILTINKGYTNFGYHSQRVDVSILSSGVYFVTIFNGKENSNQQKICIIK